MSFLSTTVNKFGTLYVDRSGILTHIRNGERLAMLTHNSKPMKKRRFLCLCGEMSFNTERSTCSPERFLHIDLDVLLFEPEP